jgi:cobalt/nickel transport system permease protein
LGRAIAAGAGAFAGVLLGAAAASAEVAASGTAPFAPFLAAMLGAHAWIGLAEGILTAAAVKLWTAAETPLTHVPPARPAFAAAGAVLTIAAAAELLGAARPDGLESALGAFGRGFGNASLTSGAPAIAAIALALLGAAACAALTFAAARPSRARGAA